MQHRFLVVFLDDTLERLVCLQTKIYGIGASIVPSSTNASESPYFMVVDYFHLSTYKLLGFAQIGNVALTKVMRSVDKE